MRPYVIGGSCDRVRQAVESAMIEGVLALPAPLSAHAERCPHCSREVREVENLLRRLRSLPASLDLGPVPGVVDRVLQATATAVQVADGDPGAAHPLTGVGAPTAEGAPPTPGGAPAAAGRRRPPQWRWVLGQLIGVAAALVIAAGGLTLLGLRIHQAVTDASPGSVVEQWMAPLRSWTEALFQRTR
ncbi:hypothetical protein [Symbiobacterium terraclitae]|uniref:hypothetical protein n=1 Tax=Symbiobacterium terraclitae TaxID=557451 RepID=UPI0035B53450